MILMMKLIFKGRSEAYMLEEMQLSNVLDIAHLMLNHLFLKRTVALFIVHNFGAISHLCQSQSSKLPTTVYLDIFLIYLRVISLSRVLCWTSMLPHLMQC